jgi:hypothetical protein
MILKYFALVSLVVIAQIANAKNCNVDEPEQLYQYQDQILALSKTSKNVDELQNKMAKPLKCLLETYKNSEDFLIKYVAGSCLQRLMGGPEMTGFKKNNRYHIIYNSLINQQIASGALLSKSEIADLASGKWGEYVEFCKGSVTDSLCSELLPTTQKIKDQNELLGATSMIILKNAYNHFSGPTKMKIARQIETLYKETANESFLKRRVIDQIYSEIQQRNIQLHGS